MSDKAKYIILATALIMLWTGIAIGRVGEVSDCKPITWTLPVQIFVWFLTPFILGYGAGDAKE